MKFILDTLVSFVYSPLQILGVLLIIAVAIGVVIYFSTLWSVEKTRNDATELDGYTVRSFKTNSCDVLLPGMRYTIKCNECQHNDANDRDNSVNQDGNQVNIQSNIQSNIQIDRVRYSYEKMYIQIIKFSIIVDGNDDNTLNKYYSLDRIISEKVTPQKITMIGSYALKKAEKEHSKSDSFCEVKVEYNVTSDDTIKYLNLMFLDELSNLYTECDFDFLSNDVTTNSVSSVVTTNDPVSKILDDHLQNDISMIRDLHPKLVDLQTSVRALLFIMLYKMLDPGLRSIGLESIQHFSILMSMHVEFLRENIYYNNRIKKDHESYADELNASIITIEDSIRRFITRAVTSKKRQIEIFDILDKYLRLLRVPTPFKVNDIDRFDKNIDTTNLIIDIKKSDDYAYIDMRMLALSSRMYGEILVKLADSDSDLHTDEVSRLYAFLSPLYTLLNSDSNSTRSDVLEATNRLISYFNKEINNKSNANPFDFMLLLENRSYTTLLESSSNRNSDNYPENTLDTNLKILIKNIWTQYGLSRRIITSDNKEVFFSMKPT